MFAFVGELSSNYKLGTTSMSASNYNWVCFRCRFTKRHPTYAKVVPTCSECGTDLHCLGGKVGVPKRLDVRGWRKLHLDCRGRLLAWSDRQAVRRVRAVHAAEREATRLRALGPAKGRQKIIRRLEEKARA